MFYNICQVEKFGGNVLINVAVLGASGYAGAEVVRILANHPQCRLKHLLAHSKRGNLSARFFPFGSLWEIEMEDTDSDEYLNDSDMVFLALPHGHWQPISKKYLQPGKKAVDLGADFRFRDASVYEAWYQEHPYKEICHDTVYGLPEIRRTAIQGQNFIANPGCYPTGPL